PLFESRRIPTLKHKLNAYAAFPAPSRFSKGHVTSQDPGAIRRGNAASYLCRSAQHHGAMRVLTPGKIVIKHNYSE
ncbi:MULTISPECIES: hypothetical protein, partial [unclassified Bradyrhizobium]|uniref:hypothetical protein n=1 Tax=unclassified Bradyrhizobium TaxID=2631580 RepID=UPI002915FE8D